MTAATNTKFVLEAPLPCVSAIFRAKHGPLSGVRLFVGRGCVPEFRPVQRIMGHPNLRVERSRYLLQASDRLDGLERIVVRGHWQIFLVTGAEMSCIRREYDCLTGKCHDDAGVTGRMTWQLLWDRNQRAERPCLDWPF